MLGIGVMMLIIEIESRVDDFEGEQKPYSLIPVFGSILAGFPKSKVPNLVFGSGF